MKSHFSVCVSHLCSGLFSPGSFAFFHPPHSLALLLPINSRVAVCSRIKSGPLGEADNISVERAELNMPVLYENLDRVESLLLFPLVVFRVPDSLSIYSRQSVSRIAVCCWFGSWLSGNQITVLIRLSERVQASRR